MDFEELSLKWYDRAYAVCGTFGIVRLAHKLKPRAVRRPRPTHSLMCECRKCKPSIQTYWRRMKSISIKCGGVMSDIEQLFDQLPGLKQVDGKSYSPVVEKDCDGYFFAYYLANDGDFLYSDGAGCPTPEGALKQLIERNK